MSRASPTVGRRQLAEDLRRHRLASGRTIDDVARHLECSPAKVSRMETGAVRIRIQDLRAMVDLYELASPEREELFTLGRQARERGWWQAFSDVVPSDSATFYGLEDGATSIDQHVPSLVPGLLQTETYARALIGSASAPRIVVDRRVELRMRRQQLLARPEPPAVHVVLDEAVLRREIGGREVMAGQLEHLLQVGSWPHVVVQVLPFGVGAHPAAGVGFTLFAFAERAVTPVVYSEQLSRNTYVDQPAEVELYISAFGHARRVAASPERSHELIASCARALR